MAGIFLYLIKKVFLKISLILTTQPHQKIRFLENFFRILNMFAIVSNGEVFCQNPQK
jgi:hypothetical protein